MSYFLSLDSRDDLGHTHRRTRLIHNIKDHANNGIDIISQIWLIFTDKVGALNQTLLLLSLFEIVINLQQLHFLFRLG